MQGKRRGYIYFILPIIMRRRDVESKTDKKKKRRSDRKAQGKK